MINRILVFPENHSFFLFGPRQTGKSTLLAQCFPRETTLFIDLLQAEDYLRFSAEPALFREEIMALSPAITHVVVDEVQRIPILLNEVHSIIESHQPRIFCLSGSSARKLRRSPANMLAGRAWIFHLFPLTHLELGEQFLLDKALQVGTLPPVFLSEIEANAVRTLRAYVQTYLEQEIQAEALVRNIGSFHRFLTLAADANGTVVNYSAIGREFEENSIKVREYFTILEDTLIGFFLQPFVKSVRKRLVKHPKFYFFDTGVVRVLLNKAAVPLIRKTEEFGKAFEHFLILEILRIASYQKSDYRFSYYRTSDDAEVDLIIETPLNQYIAIEIKASDNPTPQKLRGLYSFKSEYPGARLFCACLAPRRGVIDSITILPWKELFGEIGLAGKP